MGFFSPLFFIFAFKWRDYHGAAGVGGGRGVQAEVLNLFWGRAVASPAADILPVSHAGSARVLAGYF